MKTRLHGAARPAQAEGASDGSGTATGESATAAAPVPASPHKSVATPLAWAYAGLIGYASLYPFSGWRSQGVDPLAFLLAPWPHYWTGFDVVSNLVGYGPLGFLLALGALRGGGSALRSALAASVSGLLLSLAFETLQIYLPQRVSSNLDLALNSAGATLGALAAVGLYRFGLLRHWSRLRDDWVQADARGALVLLALWPWALVYPAAVPFGLGQVWQRFAQWMAQTLQDTAVAAWLPLHDAAVPPPLPPVLESVCVVLGLLVPCLLAFSVIGAAKKRLVALLLLTAAGLAATALSAALSWGPAVAWVWLTAPVQDGIALAVLLAAAAALGLSTPACGLLALTGLAWSLALLNHAPTSIWFAQTLQTWEQGRFIRFHGVTQWLSWLWPHLALAYLALRLVRWRPMNPRIGS